MKAKVAISNYHAGQICYPVVEAYRRGSKRVAVTLVWIDQSCAKTDAEREFNRAEFTGETFAAERWLREQGVHLDAQGIY